MSSKHPKPKDPAKKKTTRGDVINFMNYISTDENFCLRVWNTVQGVHERERALVQQGAQEDVPRPEVIPA